MQPEANTVFRAKPLVVQRFRFLDLIRWGWCMPYSLSGLGCGRRHAIGIVFALLVLFPGQPVLAENLFARWMRLAEYPTPITNNAVTSVCRDGHCTIYSFMGMTDPIDPSSITAHSYKLDSPGTDPWIRIADAPLLNSRPKIAASAIACAGKVYLIGGYTVFEQEETTEPRLFRYDPAADRYDQLADVPTEVDDTVVGVYRDRYIYLISGWHGPLKGNTQAVQVYDTETDTWRQATPIPVGGRFGHAGGVVGDHLVFIDGCADTPGYPISPSTLVGKIDSDDPTKIVWTELEPNPYRPTYRAANSQGNQDSNRIIFLGGTDNPYNYNGTGYNGIPSKPLDQIMVFDPTNLQWDRVEHLIAKGSEEGVPYLPTMDHRGLVGFDHAWVTVGGMTAAGVASRSVHAFTISVPEASTTGHSESKTNNMQESVLAGAVILLLFLGGGFVAWQRATRSGRRLS